MNSNKPTRKNKPEFISGAPIVQEPSTPSNNNPSSSFVIHEEESMIDNYPILTFNMRGVDQHILTAEKREILNDPEYFKQLSLSFYPKQKSQSATEAFL
jgi:hypothetical protein